MKKVDSVFVRNNGSLPFSDRYDGEDFTIEPGQALEMEATCAKLVFGFGEEDKTRAIRRLGWAASTAELPLALERLYSFSFHMTEAETGQTAAVDTARKKTEAPTATAAAHVDDDEPVVRQTPQPARAQVNALDKLSRVAPVSASG